MDETVATVSIDDRRKMEDEIRGQQLEARRRGDVPEPVPGATPQRRGWRRPQFILRRRGPVGEGTQALPLDDVHRLLASLGDLQHVEDLMLLEAMQASMQDEAARRARAASEGSGEAPPPPVVSQDDDDDDDDDDAAFRLAVRASLRESGGDVDDEEEEESVPDEDE